jgi:hypothetical protein
MQDYKMGSYAKPGAIENKDDPKDSSIYYRPFLYGAPSRWGMMARALGLGHDGKKGWGMRWLHEIINRHKNN